MKFRYEVSRPDYGVIEHVPTRAEARTVADDYCKRERVEYVEVFDRMAKRGAAELWKVDDFGNWFVQRRKQGVK